MHVGPVEGDVGIVSRAECGRSDGHEGEGDVGELHGCVGRGCGLMTCSRCRMSDCLWGQSPCEGADWRLYIGSGGICGNKGLSPKCLVAKDVLVVLHERVTSISRVWVW
jgi:hypothetical protein